jgi:outer membrane receptor protein involved in Fe transport
MGLQQVADEGGRFVLSNLQLGKVTLEVSYAGYETQTKEITVQEEAATIAIRLKPLANTLGNIVVSTQKRSQSLLEVPITISAVDNKFLRQMNITEFDQLSAYIPGLEMQLQSPNNPGFVIRGITSDDGDSRVQPRVSVFQDGVSISRARGAVVELFDMERIEVVKGHREPCSDVVRKLAPFTLFKTSPATTPPAR